MSVDYDPVKAHEYYMKHRELKGRRSTKGFSDTQKEQWSYAKDQLKTEHKAINTRISEARKEHLAQVTEEVKAIKQELSEQASEKIETLRERLKNMPKEEKAKMREQIQEAIGNIRAFVKEKKTAVSEQGAEEKTGIKEVASGQKEKEKADYEKRLDSAYEKIKGNK